MEFCLAARKNKIVEFVGKWMNLENISIIVSEVPQTHKDNRPMFSLLCQPSFLKCVFNDGYGNVPICLSSCTVMVLSWKKPHSAYVATAMTA